MRETGTIDRLSGPSMIVRLETVRPEVYRHWKAAESLGPHGAVGLRLPVVAGLAVGDRVVIDLPDLAPWKSILFVLGLPLVFLLAGVACGSRWPWWSDLLRLDPELAGSALGAIFAAAAFLVTRRLDHKRRTRIAVTRFIEQGA